MIALTDVQTAALMAAYDGEREQGTPAEAEIRRMGLIDDDGPTARGTHMAEGIRSEALRQWERGVRA